MTDNGIPYDHADRLGAIIAKYFPFLGDAGFHVEESHYDARALLGHMLLRRPDVVIKASLHNDDLDFFIAPAVPDPNFVKLNLLVLYFTRATVNYAEFMRRQSAPEPEPSQDELWRDWAADIARQLDRILAFAQADGYEERLADRERYEAQVAADIERQIAEYEN
jgi:hypothetical protein